MSAAASGLPKAGWPRSISQLGGFPPALLTSNTCTIPSPHAGLWCMRDAVFDDQARHFETLRKSQDNMFDLQRRTGCQETSLLPPTRGCTEVSRSRLSRRPKVNRRPMASMSFNEMEPESSLLWVSTSHLLRCMVPLRHTVLVSWSCTTVGSRP